MGISTQFYSVKIDKTDEFPRRDRHNGSRDDLSIDELENLHPD